MKQRRRRKCLHCGELFRPDPRNLRHQRYCSELACRRAGKAASQRRWLSKAANRDYFHGPENVERVRAWRARNPGYWRAARLSAKALQEHSLAQVTENQQQSAALAAPALQELSIAQPLVLMGLIAHFTGAALQEDIAISARRFRQLAQDILGTSADPLSTQAPPLG